MKLATIKSDLLVIAVAAAALAFGNAHAAANPTDSIVAHTPLATYVYRGQIVSISPIGPNSEHVTFISLASKPQKLPTTGTVDPGLYAYDLDLGTFNGEHLTGCTGGVPLFTSNAITLEVVCDVE